jgi:hypothetical protein
VIKQARRARQQRPWSGQLADDWDDTVRRQLAAMLVGSTRRVLLAIARDRAELQPGDYRIWRELHEQLRGSTVDLRPLRAMPAA